MIYGNMVGGAGVPKTIELSDEDGNTVVGVITGSKVIFTADPISDIREGKVAATDIGIVTGKKDIPSYHITTGVQVIFPNEEFKIVIDDKDKWDYTELQAMIMPYNSSAEDSVAVDRVIINDKVYNTGSTTVISTVSKDKENKSILLNITNENNLFVIRFFTYKEES